MTSGDSPLPLQAQLAGFLMKPVILRLAFENGLLLDATMLDLFDRAWYNSHTHPKTKPLLALKLGHGKHSCEVDFVCSDGA